MLKLSVSEEAYNEIKRFTGRVRRKIMHRVDYAVNEGAEGLTWFIRDFDYKSDAEKFCRMVRQAGGAVRGPQKQIIPA